jgi:hypothetical protein
VAEVVGGPHALQIVGAIIGSKCFLRRAFLVLGADGIGDPLAVVLNVAITNVACSSVDNGSIADEIVILSQSIFEDRGNRLLAISRRCRSGLEHGDLREELQRMACASVRIIVADEVLVLIEHQHGGWFAKTWCRGSSVPTYHRSGVFRIATEETFACVGGKGAGDLLGDVRWREGDDEIGEVGRLVRECIERRNKPRISRSRQPRMGM